MDVFVVEPGRTNPRSPGASAERISRSGGALPVVAGGQAKGDFTAVLARVIAARKGRAAGVTSTAREATRADQGAGGQQPPAAREIARQLKQFVSVVREVLTPKQVAHGSPNGATSSEPDQTAKLQALQGVIARIAGVDEASQGMGGGQLTAEKAGEASLILQTIDRVLDSVTNGTGEVDELSLAALFVADPEAMKAAQALVAAAQAHGLVAANLLETPQSGPEGEATTSETLPPAPEGSVDARSIPTSQGAIALAAGTGGAESAETTTPAIQKMQPGSINAPAAVVVPTFANQQSVGTPASAGEQLAEADRRVIDIAEQVTEPDVRDVQRVATGVPPAAGRTEDLVGMPPATATSAAATAPVPATNTVPSEQVIGDRTSSSPASTVVTNVSIAGEIEQQLIALVGNTPDADGVAALDIAGAATDVVVTVQSTGSAAVTSTAVPVRAAGGEQQSVPLVVAPFSMGSEGPAPEVAAVTMAPMPVDIQPATTVAESQPPSAEDRATVALTGSNMRAVASDVAGTTSSTSPLQVAVEVAQARVAAEGAAAVELDEPSAVRGTALSDSSAPDAIASKSVELETAVSVRPDTGVPEESASLEGGEDVRFETRAADETEPISASWTTSAESVDAPGGAPGASTSLPVASGGSGVPGGVAGVTQSAGSAGVGPVAPAEGEAFPVDLQDQIGPVLIRQARLIRTGEAHEMSLRLDPERLGPLHIRITLAAGTLRIGLSSSSADAQRALEVALPQLRNALLEAGLRLDRLDVGLRDSGGGNGSSEQSLSDSNGGRSGRDQSGGGSFSRQSGGDRNGIPFTDLLVDQDGRPFRFRQALQQAAAAEPTHIAAAELRPAPGTLARSRGGYGAYGALHTPRDRQSQTE